MFIELDRMDGSLLKKALSVIRNEPETAREQEGEGIEVVLLNAKINNFFDITATPKVPSLGRAMDEAIAASVARSTLVSESPAPTGTTTEQVVVAPSSVKQKQNKSTPSLIPLNPNCFQQSYYLVDRGDRTDAAKGSRVKGYTETY